jgi:hypothetical protein
MENKRPAAWRWEHGEGTRYPTLAHAARAVVDLMAWPSVAAVALTGDHAMAQSGVRLIVRHGEGWQVEFGDARGQLWALVEDRSGE